MAEGVVSFVAESLGELLIQEAEFLHGEGGHARQVLEGLRRLQSFLKDAEARQEESVRNLVAEVRKLAYDAGDVLESFVLGVASKRRGGIQNILKRYVCFLDESIGLRKVGAIKTRITKLTTRLQAYEIRAVREEVSSSSFGSQRHWGSYSPVGLDEEDFVGLEEDVEKLVAHLVKDEGRDKCYQVVSICGMGGLGKTTIAKRIYNHPAVKFHFSAVAWVCISQQWQTKDILQQILISLTREIRDQILHMGVEVLIEKLLEFQQNKKCLVVLDDIWSPDAWDGLRPAFQLGKMGSKLLLTSRNIEVAKHVDPDGFLHQPRLLNEGESWELLQKKLFATTDPTDPGDVKKRELGRDMVRDCGGLPLAIVVLRGVLVTKQTLGEWEMVQENINSLIRGRCKGQQHYGRILEMFALSFNDLPYQLKPCFLYLGKFLEDSEIETERLYQLWIAENMVLSKDRREGETMMDVAESYLGELAHRCMLQVQLEEEESPFRKYKWCRLHDLMRELCLVKAKEIDFFKVVDFQQGSGHEAMESSSSTSTGSRRLVIFLGEEDIGERHVPLDKETSQHLRSLLLLNGTNPEPYPEVYTLRHRSRKYDGHMPRIVRTHLNDFKLLRVLAIEAFSPSNWREMENTKNIDKGFGDPHDNFELPKAVANLIHLRYLSFKDTQLFMFPSSIANLEHLQTLDLRLHRFVTLHQSATNVLRKMRRLRHLYLPRWVRKWHFKTTELLLDGLSGLEVLENFDPSWCDIEDLLKLTNLRKLTVNVGENLDNLERIIDYFLNINPNRLRHSYLSICVGKLGSEKGQTILRQMSRLAWSSLHELLIGGRIGKLPGYDQHFNFSPSLIMLCLWGSEFEEDPMPTLEKLPNLRTLSLNKDTFLGKEMVCSAKGFPQLRSLQLCSFSNLEKWRVDEGAMPNISILHIWCCKKLEMIPDGLRFLTALQELHLFLMPEEFNNRVRVVDGKEGEDFHKVRHVPSISIIDV